MKGLILAATFLLVSVFAVPAYAQHETKTVDGLKVTLAITSVEEIKKHPEEHPEIKMHGGPKGTHHLLIHIEDEKTGKVVGDASVKRQCTTLMVQRQQRLSNP